MNKIVLEGSNSNIKLKDNDSYLLMAKNNVVIDVENNALLNVFNQEDIDQEFIFNVSNNSNLDINIFDASKNIKRNIIINLNGESSNVTLNLSSISLGKNNYEVSVFHNSKNTTSQTNLHGLALDNNEITFKNNGHIINGSNKSILNQDNKIIIMGDNNSKIEPNLFIDEYDIKASHGAYIGKFDEEEIFYLKTRGLSEKESYNLLINGFLLGEFKIDKEYIDDLIKIINKYWR